MYKKDGLLYSSKEEYDADCKIDHEIRRIKQKHISQNIDRDLERYVKREEKRGTLKWNP